MSLLDFLNENRALILELTEKKIQKLGIPAGKSGETLAGVSAFLDQVISSLEKRHSETDLALKSGISEEASRVGKTLIELGFTISHVVNVYGAVCQGITESALASKVDMDAADYAFLNMCLDLAIASAVTKYTFEIEQSQKRKELKTFGALAHEIRNSLNRATVAFEMVSKGFVGVGGSTSNVLGKSLEEMKVMVDRAITNVKNNHVDEVQIEKFSLSALLGRLTITTAEEALSKSQKFSSEIEPSIYIDSDKLLITQAVGNLIQNALKFTKPGGRIKLSAHQKGEQVFIEVENEAEPLPPGLVAGMFKAFTQGSKDKTGLGLGLSIARQAVTNCGGTLEVRSIDSGCVFVIKLPKSSDEV